MSGGAGELAQQEDLGTTGTFRTALLHTRDVASAARFYNEVFGWQLQDGAKPTFMLRGQRVAGIRRTTSENPFGFPTSQSTMYLRSELQLCTCRQAEQPSSGASMCRGQDF